MTIDRNSFVPELFVQPSNIEKVKRQAISLARWDLTARQICDLELLMNGAFFPLTGFLGKKIMTMFWKI